MMPKYLRAILHLRPGAQVALVGGEGYENIEWGTEPPIPQAELDAADGPARTADAVVARRKEITARLQAIDTESVRALRAKTVGKGKPQDDAKLSTLDLEADGLRAELAAL